MGIKTIADKGYDLLDEWYQKMLSQQLDKAMVLKKEIDDKFSNRKKHTDSFIYYSLLNFRYQMLTGDFEKGLEGFDYIKDMPDCFLKYYYHFFHFIYHTETGNYNCAEYHREIAANLLDMMPNEAETAEYHYRIALYHYYLSQPTLAIHYATKALEYFSEYEGYKAKVGACQNTLGMACITLQQYEMAEEYLVSALNIFEHENELRAALTVRYNLGVFYADQNLSELAIRHLTDVFREFGQPRAPYQKKGIHVLAKEHFKLGNFKEANFYIEEGFKDCTTEYKYHFTILKTMLDNEPIEKLEKIMLDSISFFKEQDLWNEIQKYSEILAVKWYNMGEKDKASDYYHMGYEARNLLKEKGRLK
ncbi:MULTISPECIES: tetratricopeptide repeat protein [unclassified Bacillus cereus group]|uniref:response regulator aspartate phosphatase n=1 Tax=unclassified Bacillus cereus group TaxID=2750818 RepID=UPI001F5840F2|nr:MULTISPECIES: tetratricopeptide repeat protein [unclassified Bacillus cereus group]